MVVEERSGLPKLGPLYRAAVLGMIRRRPPTPAGLPDVELVARDVPVDLDRLAAYDRVCGFRLTDPLPVTYPHVLAFPLGLALMTRPDFPLPLPGLVHTANRIELLAPIRIDARPTLRVLARNLRERPGGAEVEIVTSALLDDECVWREVSTYLSRPRGAAPPSTDPGAGGENPAPTAMWEVPATIGRRYAAASGDRNPIHTSRLVARFAGFRGPIAHGMWTLARSLAALEGRLPETMIVESRFRRPLMVPGRVALEAEQVAVPGTVAGAMATDWPTLAPVPAWLAPAGRPEPEPPAGRTLWRLTVRDPGSGRPLLTTAVQAVPAA